MLLKPKATVSPEDFENKLLIEKWIKRNSSSKVTIGQVKYALIEIFSFEDFKNFIFLMQHLYESYFYRIL